MARNGEHSTKGFTDDGGKIIAAVAARVCPPGWASSITNCVDKPIWATILLFRPDGSEYTEDAYYADVAVAGDEVWWENKLRDVLARAKGS